MRLSKRGEYGLRAMIDLAILEPERGNGVVQIKEIAEREKYRQVPRANFAHLEKTPDCCIVKWGLGEAITSPDRQMKLPWDILYASWMDLWRYPVCKSDGV
jgi:hypothetical protein